MENINQCILNTAEEILGERKVTTRKEWISDNIVETINERRKYKNTTDQLSIEKIQDLEIK